MEFKNIKVFNFDGAFRGMRNPKESWHLSDSYFGIYDSNNSDKDIEVAKKWLKRNDPILYQSHQKTKEAYEKSLLNYCNSLLREGLLNKDTLEIAFIGPNDMELAQRLINAGPEHRKFLRQIFVSVDITAPIYWWKEMSTYKIGTTTNSTSTMHKITSKPITFECFEMDGRQSPIPITDFPVYSFINYLEELRLKFIETKDKKYWKELIRWLPESWLQTRTWTGNYEVLHNICSQRTNHKLNEWDGKDNSKCSNFINTFCRRLPYAQYLIFNNEGYKFPKKFEN